MPLLAAACGGGSSGVDGAPRADAAASSDAGPPDAPPDLTPPAAPTAFTATWNEGTLAIDLAWTNPADADLAGILIVRSSSGPVTDVPADGTTYADGDVLPGGGLVVFAAAGEVDVDTLPASGTDVYWAWAYDAAHNHSVEHVDASVADVDGLRLDLSVVGAPTVQIVGHPWPLELADASATLSPASAIMNPNTEGELIVTATTPGAAGNGATLVLVDGGDASALTVATVGTDVTVTFDRYTHTARELANAVNLDAAAAAVLTVYAPIDGVSIGARTVTLAGGVDENVRVRVRATNAGGAPLSNAKAMLTASSGTLTSRRTVADQAVAHFGSAALDVGASAWASFDLEAFAAATSPVVIDYTPRTDPSVIFSGGWDDGFVALDTSGSGAEMMISSESLGYQAEDGDSRYRDGFVSADGRTMYLANHNMPNVVGIDLTTLRPTLAVDLDNGTGIGFVDSVVPSPDGLHMYAVVTYGAHAAAWQRPGLDLASVCTDDVCVAVPEQVDLVKLQTSDLTEVGRVTLHTASTRGARGRKLSMNTAGTVGAVPIFREGAVALVDLTAMTLTRTVDVSAVNLIPVQVAVSPDGLSTYVAFKDYAFTTPGSSFNPDIVDDGTLHVINNADGVVTAFAAPPLVVAGNKPGFLEFGPDGRLFYGRKDIDVAHGLSVYDFVASAWTALTAPGARSMGLEFSADGTRYYVFNGAARVVEVRTTVDDAVVATLPSIEAGFGHKLLLTP